MSVFCVFWFSLSLDSFSIFSGLVCLWWNIFCSEFVFFGLVYLCFLVGMFVFSLLLFEVVLGLYFLHWSVLYFLHWSVLCFLDLILAVDGSVSEAAKYVGLSTGALSRLILSHDSLRMAVNQLRDSKVTDHLLLLLPLLNKTNRISSISPLLYSSFHTTAKFNILFS